MYTYINCSTYNYSIGKDGNQILKECSDVQKVSLLQHNPRYDIKLK